MESVLPGEEGRRGVQMTYLGGRFVLWGGGELGGNYAVRRLIVKINAPSLP